MDVTPHALLSSVGDLPVLSDSSGEEDEDARGASDSFSSDDSGRDIVLRPRRGRTAAEADLDAAAAAAAREAAAPSKRKRVREDL